MPALHHLLTLLLCGLLAATPVAAAPAAVGGPDAETAEVECLAVARPAAPARVAPAAAPTASSRSGHPRPVRPAAAPAPYPVRTHVLHCVWRE